MPGSQDSWPFCGNRHRVLEMARQGPVGTVNRPVVGTHPDAVLTGRGHRLDGENHPLLQLRTRARFAVIRDLWVLVHLTPDTVPDQGADHGKAVCLDLALHRGGDV